MRAALLLPHDQLAADELDAVAGLEDGSPDRARDRRDCATLPSHLDGQLSTRRINQAVEEDPACDV